MEKYVTRIGDVTIQRVVPGTAAAVEPVRVMESEELLRAVKEEPMDEEEEEEEEGMEGEEEGGGEEEEGRINSNPEEGEGEGGGTEENGGEGEPDGEEEERNKVKKLLNLGEELQLTEGIQLGEGVQLLRVKDEPPDNGYEPEEEGIEEDGMMEEAKEDGEEEERGEQEQGEGEEGEEGRGREKEEGEGGEEEEEEEEAGGKRKAESDQEEETGLSKKKKLEEEDKDKDKKKAINLRRNIREVMDEAQLDEATLAAQRQEAERLRRVQDQQKYLRENVQVQRQIQINKLNQKNRMISLLQGGSSLLKSNNAANSGPSTVLVKLGSGQAQALNKKTLEVLRGSKSGASGSGDTSKPGRVAISRPGMVTPSVSIAPVRSTPPAPTHPSDKKVYAAADGEYVDDDASEVVTISSSDSENDCILISEGEEEDEDEEEEEDVDPTNSGMHTNDLYNIPDEQGRVLINVGKPESESEIFLAPQIARIIKPHQIGGVRFLFDNVVESLERFNSSTGFGCILAHSMGLGKTLQVVSFCDVFLRETAAKTVMCIMPINTLQNWMAEFNMWLPMDPSASPLGAHGEVRPRNFNIYVLNDMHKTISARAKVVEEWSKEGGVLLIGYEMYRQLSLKRPGRTRKGKKRMQEEDMDDEKNKPLIESMHEALVRPGPDLVICDEGHRIKNSHASISHALKQIRSKRRVVLTGYPLQNNLLEYWCMVDFVRPNYLGTKTEFSNMFERPIQNGQCIDSTPQDIRLMRYRAHVLHSLLEGFVQRRSHSVLRNTLPQKEEYVLLVRLSPFQRKLYDTFMNEVVRTKAVPNPLKAFAVCCKIWNHPDILYNFIKKRELDELQDLDLEETAGLAGTGTARGDVVGPNSPRRASGPGGAREKRKGPVKKVAPIKPEVAQSQQQQSGLPQQQQQQAGGGGGEMEGGAGPGFDLYPPSSCYPVRGAQDLPASYPAYRPPPGAPAPPASGYYPGYYPPHQDTTTSSSYYPTFPPSSMDPSYPTSIPSSYGFENYPNLPQNQNWSGLTHPPIKQEKNQGKSPKESYEATPKPGFQEYYPIKEEKTGIKEEKQTFLCSGFSGGQVSYNYRDMGGYPGYPGYQPQEYPTTGWGKGAFASFGHPMEQDMMGNQNLQASLGHHKDSQPVGSSQMQSGNHMGLGEERNPKERDVYSGSGQKMYNSQGTQLGLHGGQEYQGSQNQKESNQRMYSAGERQSGGQQSMFHGHMSSEHGSSMHGKQEQPQQGGHRMHESQQQQGLFNSEGPHYGIHSLEQQQSLLRGHNNTDNRQNMFGAQGMHPQDHQTNFMASHQDKQKNVQGSAEFMMGDMHSMFPMGQRGQQVMYPGVELGQGSQRNKNTQERTSSGQQQGMFGGGGQHEMMDFREHLSSQTQQGIMGNQNNQGSVEGMSRSEGTQDGAQDIQGPQRMHMSQEYVQGRHQMNIGPSDNQQRGGRHSKDQASPQQNLLSPQNIADSSPGRHGAQDHIQNNQHGGHGYHQGNQMSPHNSDSQLSMFGHMDSQFGIQDLMSMPGMRSGEGRNGGLLPGGADNMRGRNQTGKQQDPGLSNTQNYSISQMLMLNQPGMVGNQQQQGTSGNQKVGDKSIDSEIQAVQHGMHAQTNQLGVHSGQNMTRGQQHGMVGSTDSLQGSQHMHGNHNMPAGQQNHNMHPAQQNLAGNMHDFSDINIGGNQHQQILTSHNIGGNQNVSHDGSQNQRGMFSSPYQGDGTSSFHIQGNQPHSVFPNSNQQNQNLVGNPNMSGHQNVQGGQQGQNSSGDHLKGDVVKGSQHNFVQNCSGGSLMDSSQYIQNYGGDQQNSGYQHFSSTAQKQQYHGGKSSQNHHNNSGKHKAQQTSANESQQFVYNNQNAQMGMNQHHSTQTQHEQQSPPGSQYKSQGGMSGQGQFGDQRSMQQKGIMSGMFDNSQNESIHGGFEDEQKQQGLFGATTEPQYPYDKNVLEESGSQSEKDGAKCAEQPDIPTEEDKTCEKETDKREEGDTEDVAKSAPSAPDKEEEKKEKGGGKKEEEEKEKGAATATPQKGGRDEPGIPYDWAVELLKGYLPGDIYASAKMTVFFCILEESIALGDRILVFSQSLFTLNLMEELLQQQCVPGKEDRWAKSVNYYRLDGSTSAMEREKLINEFNSNPNLHLFLVSTRAGSLGINLVGANRVIVFDASWNPCHDTQAVCRVYRYGQKKPCFVYRLVTDNCLEKKIYDRQINKQGMSDRVVDECNPDAHLSIKEVTSLCWDDKEDEAPKDFSNLHDSYIDVVLQKVIQQHSSLLSKEPFQHESLLVDRKEKKLSQAEKRMAKRSYELEKQASTRPIYNNGVVQNQNRAKPMASVRPMQAEMTNQRPRGWIPASVWQRQGMSAQEMTLPLDVVIPTNSADRASIVLKAGQKVMVLKSPKGIYMQLENGKIIAIRTAMKMGGGKKTISTNQTTTLKGGVELIPRRGPGLARSASTTGRARPVRAVGPVSRPSSVPPVSVTVTRNRTSDTVPLSQLQTQSQSQSRSSATTPLSGIHLPPGVTLQSVSSSGASQSQDEAGQPSPQPPQSPQTQSEQAEPTEEAPLLSPQSDHSQPESQQSSIMSQPLAEQSTMMSQPQSQESTMMSEPQAEQSTMMSQPQSQESTMMSQPQSQQSTILPLSPPQQSLMPQSQPQQSTISSQSQSQQPTILSQSQPQQSTMIPQHQSQQSTMMSQPQAQQSTIMPQPQSQHSKVMSQVQSQQSSIMPQHLSQQSTIMSQPLPQQSKVMSQVQSQQSTMLSQHQSQQSSMLSQHQSQQSTMLSPHQSPQSTMSQPLPQQSKVMSQVQSQQSAILSQSQQSTMLTQHQPQQSTMFSKHPQQQSMMLPQHQPQPSAMSQTQTQTQSAMLPQTVTGQAQMFPPSSQSQLLPPHTQQTQLFPPSQQSQLLPPPSQQQSQLLPPPSQQQSQLLPPSQQHSQLFPPPPQHSQLSQSSHFLGQQQSPSAYLPPTGQHPLPGPQYLPGQQYLPAQYPPLPHYSVPPSHYLPPPSPSHPPFLSTSPTQPQFLPPTHPSQQPQYLQHPSAQSQLMPQQPQSFGAVHHRLREEERKRSTEGTKRGDKEVQPNPFTAAAAASLSNLVQQQQPGGGTA